MNMLQADIETAVRLDERDPLRHLRNEFALPVGSDGRPKTYLVGNSLGLLAAASREAVMAELDRWASLGVDGHFTGETAWAPMHELVAEPLAHLVGGHVDEVVAMNSLTVNLHLLLMSFYRPTSDRHKLLIEDHAFPSDHFAVESQIRQRGFDSAESLVVVSPREGEATLRTEDLVATIEHHGSSLACVLLPGVQYYTGQVLDLATIATAAHQVGASVGFDLAHAIGNIPMALHDWHVDFAVWCSYKYLNSGPGGVGGAFVHQRHINDQSLPKLLGWWGTRKETRFEMATEFEAIPTVESWQLSNAPVLALAALRGSLEVFERAGGIGPLRQKAELQAAYLDILLEEKLAGRIRSITPTATHERGCQVALEVIAPGVDGRDVFDELERRDVVCDWRYPNVIRAAPVPLYSTFQDIYRFVDICDEVTR